MTQIATSKIKEKLKQIWPLLRKGERIWILDRFKDVPTKNDLLIALRQTQVDILKLQDCDNYALQLHAAVDLVHQTWAFGEVVGFADLPGFTGVHAMNFCLTESGMYLIEPTTDEIQEGTKENLNVFFVRA